MDQKQLQHAVRTLQRGGIIAYPSEGVWGLGCDPTRESAVRRILALKQRPAAKGLILIAADWRQLLPYLLPLDADLQSRVLATWPGPVTWLLPAAPAVADFIRGDHSTVAVRVTAHPLCRRLCELWGKPLVSTSANPAGQPPALSRQQVETYFVGAIDCILEGKLTRPGIPTTIRDGVTGCILRE